MRPIASVDSPYGSTMQARRPPACDAPPETAIAAVLAFVSVAFPERPD